MVGARHTKAIHPQLDYIGTDEETPTELVQQQTYQKTQSTTVSEPTTQGATLRRSSYSSY